jgi:hypothetical protein
MGERRQSHVGFVHMPLCPWVQECGMVTPDPRDDYEDRNGGPDRLDRKNLTRACCVAGITGKA